MNGNLDDARLAAQRLREAAGIAEMPDGTVPVGAVPVGTVRAIAYRLELEITIPGDVAPILVGTSFGTVEVQPLWMKVPYEYDPGAARWKLMPFLVHGNQQDMHVCEHNLAEYPEWLRSTLKHHQPLGVPITLPMGG